MIDQSPERVQDDDPAISSVVNIALSVLLVLAPGGQAKNQIWPKFISQKALT
jgi:hypothetical protein